MRQCDLEKLIQCIENVRKAGGQCANCCHNLADHPSVDETTKRSLMRAVSEFDNAYDDLRSHLSSL